MSKVIVKYDGSTGLLKNCRKIRNEYYEKDVDCFFVNGKWNRIDNGLIFFDYRDSNWKRKADFNTVLDYIDETTNKKILVDDENVIMANKNYYLNAEVAFKHGLKESINSENYVSVEKIERKGIGCKYGPLKYNLNTNKIDKLNEQYVKLFDDPIPRNVFLSKFLRNYTFGLEFETSNGYIRRSKLHRHGVVPLLDGSLRKSDGTEPFEFTTIPYQGIKGIKTIESFTEVLDLHCEFDLTCSLHIHVGNFEMNTKSKIVSFYKLLTDIQNDVFKMFPAYKLDPSLINKDKNYCKLLPKIDFSNLQKDTKISTIDYYTSIIYTALTGYTMSNDYNFSNTADILGGSQKWNIQGRYSWVNLISLFFNPRKTVEFRVHEPTFNKTNVVNWLLLIISILEYCNKNESYILQNKVSLDNIFKFSDYGQGLKNYYNDRVSFYNERNSKKDFTRLYDKTYNIL